MGLGHILAGGLEGLGTGMSVQAQRTDDERQRKELGVEEERRAIALENLRANNATDARTQAGEIDDNNAARQVVRTTNANIIQTGVEAETEAALAAQMRIYAVEDREDNQGHAAAMAALASRLSQSENRAQQLLGAQIERELAGGTLDRIEITADGQFMKVYKNGRTTLVGGATAPPPKSTTASDGSVLGDVRGTTGGGLGNPAPARAPAATGKTYTQAEAEATARARNIPVARVHTLMRDAGYKLTN